MFGREFWLLFIPAPPTPCRNGIRGMFQNSMEFQHVTQYFLLNGNCTPAWYYVPYALLLFWHVHHSGKFCRNNPESRIPAPEFLWNSLPRLNGAKRKMLEGCGDHDGGGVTLDAIY
jgi:hypothetical protein